MKPGGLIVPVLTPFDENGNVDLKAFRQHLEFLVAAGVKRIMVNGTTGEFYSTLPEEHKLLLETARRYFDGYLVSHLGGTGLAQNQLEIQWANDCGANAVAALPPIYPGGLPAVSITRYLRALQEKVENHFIIYNFSKNTGNPITPEILKEVPHHAMKDTDRNLDLINSAARYLVGSSSGILEPVRKGAAGFVSAAANVCPKPYCEFEALMGSGAEKQLAEKQDQIREVAGKFKNNEIATMKQSLAETIPGYPAGVRLPL